MIKLIKFIIYILLFIVLFKLCSAGCDSVDTKPDYSQDDYTPSQRWCSTHERSYTGECSSCKARTPKVKY